METIYAKTLYKNQFVKLTGMGRGFESLSGHYLSGSRNLCLSRVSGFLFLDFSQLGLEKAKQKTTCYAGG